MEGMTTEKPLEGKPKPYENTVGLNRLPHPFRARGIKSAMAAKPRRDEFLVKQNGVHQQTLHQLIPKLRLNQKFPDFSFKFGGFQGFFCPEDPEGDSVTHPQIFIRSQDFSNPSFPAVSFRGQTSDFSGYRDPPFQRLVG